MMLRRTVHWFLGLAVAQSAIAEPVLIVNPSFEEPVLADGDFDAAPGWEAYDPGGAGIENGNYFGAWNPSTSAYPGGASAGQNVGWVFNDLEVEIGLEQSLAASVTANTRYTLSVMVGNPLPYFGFPELGGFPGYRIELVAKAGPSQTILASDSNTLSIPEGTFERSIVTYTAPASGEVVGQSLTLRLIARPGTGVEVDFDNVTLDATPVGLSVPLKITRIELHQNGDITLEWDSRPGATYTIHGSGIPNDFLPVVTEIPSAGDSTAATFQDPASGGNDPARTRFYILKEEDAGR